MAGIESQLQRLAEGVASKIGDAGTWKLGPEPFFTLSQTTFAVAVLDWQSWPDAALAEPAVAWLKNALGDCRICYTRTLAWPLFLLRNRLSSSADLRDDLIARLLQRSSADGGWGHGPHAPDERGSGRPDPLPTALAVLALCESGTDSPVDVSEHVRSGAQYLHRWWSTCSHERAARPGSWALSLLALSRADCHICDPRDVVRSAYGLANLSKDPRNLGIERIEDAARFLDSPYFLLTPAWVLVALTEVAPLETLFDQVRLVNSLIRLIQADGSVGLVPDDPQPHIYSAFNVYLSLRTFMLTHGKSKLLENIVSHGEEAQTVMTKRAKDTVRVFIGSSVEGINIARTLRTCFEHDPFDVVVWEDGVFAPSATTIESLETAARGFDFAVLILTPDDLTASRDEVRSSIRDNLIFEAGLFMGAIGRRRVFLLRPRIDIKWPTDLLGITPVDYDEDRFLREPRSAISSAADKIRTVIRETGPR